jgi:MFS family permease
MAAGDRLEHGLGWFYDLLTGDEDARVCKDIPESACNDQPRNFFSYLFANLLTKISDELVSARLTLPWLFSILGIPASFIAFLVPIREAGILLPQLIVAAYIRSMQIRKFVWIMGALLSSAALFLMALIGYITGGLLAGWLLIIMLLLYSLARGLCSVSAKDVLGKTVSKSRRGRLMGYSTALAGVATVAIGLMMQADFFGEADLTAMLALFLVAGLVWLLASIVFITIAEPAGATEGGGNALYEAFRSLRLISDDRPFRQYLLSRIMLLSVVLVIPFYVMLIQLSLGARPSLLGWLIIISGLSQSLSAPLIGFFADRSSRLVMAVASFMAGCIGVLVWLIIESGDVSSVSTFFAMLVFFFINLAYGAARLGRKVYLVDLATADNRAQYVAVSNSIIGFMLLIGGTIGFAAEVFAIHTVILILSIVSLLGGIYILRLKETSV